MAYGSVLSSPNNSIDGVVLPIQCHDMTKKLPHLVLLLVQDCGTKVADTGIATTITGVEFKMIAVYLPVNLYYKCTFFYTGMFIALKDLIKCVLKIKVFTVVMIGGGYHSLIL